MKKMVNLIILVVLLAFVLINAAFYKVDQTEQVLVLQLGEPIRVIKEPGLKMKIPFIQKIVRFDKRFLEYDAAPREIITADKKTLVVDNYARWKIVEPLEVYKTVRNVEGAQSRLDDIIYSQMRVELGVHTLSEVVSKSRSDIMRTVLKESASKLKGFGIEIVDVRIKRAELPRENEQAVFGRMKAEREREAKKYRSEGEEEAQKIRSSADRDREIILAQAYKEAQIAKGEGDAVSIKVYAEALQKDPEFYDFIRSLEAYEKSLTSDATTMILSTDSEFFRYLK